MINDADTLRWLAQQNCITPHVWNARCDMRDQPDRLVFDLDPDRRRLRRDPRRPRSSLADVLRELGLVPFAKVTGSRGIHIVAPLQAHADADEVRERRGRLAERIAAEHPDTLTTVGARRSATAGSSSTSPATPTGRRSSRPYAVRALPGAPVAVPVDWDEVADAALRPQQFKLRGLEERLARAAIPGPRCTASAKAVAERL